jgi:cation:H+ antiporter
MLKRDGYFLLFISFLFYVMVVLMTFTARFNPWINAVVTRVEGLFLLLLYIVYVMFLIHYREKIKKIPHFSDYMKYLLTFRYIDTASSLATGKPLATYTRWEKDERKHSRNPRKTMAVDIFFIVVSLAMVIIGAYVVIDRSIFFAVYFNVPKTLVGFTLIALGTSLPELSVCIAAARKGYGDIILGNVIGSNIANVLLIGGTAALITPLATDFSTIAFTGPAMVVLSIILLVFTWSGWKLERWEGLVFLGIYAALMVFIFAYDILL